MVAIPVPMRRPTFREKYDALVRHRLAATDTEHADRDVELVDLVKDEMTRGPAVNRALRRAAGWRSGHTRRRYFVGQMAKDMTRLDAIEANPQRLAQYQAKQEAARARSSRVSTRIADRRERLSL